MAGDTEIHVEVAFAMPGRQEILSLQVPSGTTAWVAVEKSGIGSLFPDLVLDSSAMGIFSRRLNGVELPHPDKYVLVEGDRVEIYRQLLIDPKQARLDRARKKQSGNQVKNQAKKEKKE